MHVLVTGCAGFIGSSLCERLLADGHAVTGVDCFTAYYARPIKEGNLAPFRTHPRFAFRELDLSADPLADAVGEAEVVFHLAAYPGLMKSWTDFDLYSRHNLTATQRLLEAGEAADSPWMAAAVALRAVAGWLRGTAPELAALNQPYRSLIGDMLLGASDE